MRKSLMRPYNLVRSFVFKRVLALYGMMTYRAFDLVFGKPLRDWSPDIIHAHDGVTLPTAAHAARDLGVKLIFDSHELEAHRNPPLSWQQRRRVERMERRYLPQADRVITVTNLLADFLAREYQISRPTVVFNAPPAQPRPSYEDRSDVRSELYLRSDRFLFVYTGQVTLNRGLELAIIALSKLQGFRDPNVRFDSDYHLAIVGGVQKGHDDALIRLADAYEVGHLLHFLKPVAPRRVAQYISTANASIIPIIPVTLSYEYAMPNKLFEAILSGNPIIGSDLMEMAPFIEQHRLGLTYQADSPDDCVEKMIQLITCFPDFHRSTERQTELAEEYSWEAQEKVLLAMYEDMLSGR